MFDDPPGCWLHLQASFAAAFLPRGSVGQTTNVFPFPSVTGDSAAIGGGNMITAFSDRPEVREVVRFLLSEDYGALKMVETGQFLSANRQFDPENYPPFARQQAEALQAALESDAFRFDASDLMPSPIGDRMFFGAMMTYLAEGPGSLDRILTELDAAWPDDTG
jgi:alpha-glucoside transport system substrate-binding protein